MKKWVVLDQSAKIKNQRQISEIITVLLENRGIQTEEDREKFLHPNLSDITFESVGIDQKECDKALTRIKTALEKNESIVVYTDYDVDGVSSGALVWETLYELGGRVMPYVPHRVDEGYGLSKKGIDKIKKEFGATLIITVDHGITGIEKIKYASTLGIDTIIVDHHVKPVGKLECIACVHTTRMTAAGIAWLFSDFLIRNLSEWDFGKIEKRKNENLELAVLGTVADLIPLMSENRILAFFGLIQLRHSKRIGLKTLFEESGIIQSEIDTYTISHMISPRINAVGRITHAIDALRLLCTKDKSRAFELASHLGVTNKNRQALTTESLTHALLHVEEEKKKIGHLPKMLIVHDSSYQQGIIGLIAGKLTETFTRPSIALSVGEVYSKASARSVPGFNIVEVFQLVSDLLVDVGGHPMAAGFTVETKNIEELKSRLLKIAQEVLTDDMLVKTIQIDIELPFESISKDLFKIIRSLAPFGVGNREPVFVTSAVKVIGVRKVGKEGKHLKLVLEKGIRFDGIGFGMGDMYEKLSENGTIDVVYTIDENEWNNETKLQLKVKDVRIAE